MKIYYYYRWWYCDSFTYEQVKTAGRATQGVRLIKVHDSKVSSVEVVAKNEEEVVEEGEEESE